MTGRRVGESDCRCWKDLTCVEEAYRGWKRAVLFPLWRSHQYSFFLSTSESSSEQNTVDTFSSLFIDKKYVQSQWSQQFSLHSSKIMSDPLCPSPCACLLPRLPPLSPSLLPNTPFLASFSFLASSTSSTSLSSLLPLSPPSCPFLPPVLSSSLRNTIPPPPSYWDISEQKENPNLTIRKWSQFFRKNSIFWTFLPFYRFFQVFPFFASPPKTNSCSPIGGSNHTLRCVTHPNTII